MQKIINKILLIVLCFITNFLFAQTNNYNTIIEKNKIAKQHKIKTIERYSPRYVSGTNKLHTMEQYDSNGNIVFMREHSGNLTHFFYQKNLLIRLIAVHSSFKDTTLMEIGYDSFGRKSFFLLEYIPEGKTIKRDTTFYFYNANNKISKTVNGYKHYRSPLDTLYYFYDYKGKTYCSQINEVDTISFDDTDSSELFEKDSFGNCISYKYRNKNNEKWVDFHKGIIKYKNNLKSELMIFSCSRLRSNCKGKLKFYAHYKYEYNDKGLLLKEYYLNKKGKVIDTDTYLYTYY